MGLWLLLLTVCIAVIYRTTFKTDMGAFLPHAAPMAQRVLTEQAITGAASHLVLVAIDGAPPQVLAALSAGLAQRMRRQPAFINIINGDERSFAGVEDYTWRNRYVLGPDVTAGRFTTAGLHAALLGDLGLLGSDFSVLIQQTLAADPTGEAMTLLRQMGAGVGPASRDGVWVSADASRALLLVHTMAPGFDIDAQQRALALIDADLAETRAAVPGGGAARLRETGPGVFAVRIRDTTKRDVTRLSLLATAGAVGLLAFAYRSPLVLLLGILPVVSGALAAVAAVSLAFGFVHGVTLGFGVTLIGESLDYAIYLFTQTGRFETAGDTLKRIWPTLRLGALTSVVGFSAMLASSFVGFAQLGLFSIIGLAVAAGVTRFVLPQLVPRGFFASGAAEVSRPLRAVIRHRRRLRWLVGAGLLAAAISLAMHRGSLWNPDLSDLSPVPAAAQALDVTLRHDLGIADSRFFVVVRAADRQAALRASEALAPGLQALVEAHRLGGYDLPSTFLPSKRTEQARRAALPDPTTLRARLSQASAGLPFRPGEFESFLQAAAAAGVAPPLTVASLPPALALRLSSLLVADGGGWVVMVPLRGVTDPDAVRRLTAAAQTGAVLIDLNQESSHLLATFQRQATLLAGIGSLAIALLLLVSLRSVKRAATVLAPLAAAVLLTAALLTLGDGRLSIFMVVGFLLIVAVGSNYCLFFERAENDTQARQRSISSVVLANLCTVSAYGLLSLSGIPVLHDTGITVAIGTFLSLICAAVLSGGEAA